MIVFRQILFTFLLAGLGVWASAQSNRVCYELFVQEGKEAQAALNFDLAIYKFEAAAVCRDKPLEDNLDELLKAANEARFRAITEARDHAKRSAEEARQQVKISEGNRLAFLANREREKGNTDIALKLAFHAMELTKGQTSAAIRRAFGNAVYWATLQKWTGHRQSIRSASFSPDGNLLLTCANDSSIIVWKKGGEKLLILPAFPQPIQSAHFSPSGKEILTASGTQVHLWNLQGQQIHTFSGHSDLVYEAVFSPDGKKIATCSRDQSTRIWDAQTAAPLALCKGMAAQTKVQFAPDQSCLLSLAADKSIGLWSLDGKIQQVLKYQDLYFGGAVFGPGENQLLSFTVDQSLQIWNYRTGKLIQTLRKHQQLIRQIAMAPNHTGFLSGASDKRAIFWKASGEIAFQLDDHLAGLEAVGFSEDSQYLLTSSKDQSAKLYLADGQLLMDFSAFPGSVKEALLSPDNKWLAVVGDHPEVYLCQNPDTYYPYLQQHPPAEFTPEEKEKYSILEY